MTESDRSVGPVAAALLACLKTEIAKVPNPPRWVSMRVGLVVDLLASSTRDECCEGLAWVRVAQVFPSSTFPNPDATYSPVGTLGWSAVLELGSARCAPRPPANKLPTVEQWDAVSQAVLDDAAAMRRTMCCWSETDPDRQYLPGLWQPLPVEGGCVGGTQQLTVAIGDCDCGPDETEENPALAAFTIPGAGDFAIDGFG